MAFTRSFLKDHGVPEDQIDAIMQERQRTLADYVPKADVQAQIDAAVAGVKPAPVTDSDEYKKLEAEFNDFKARTEAKGSEDFKDVKSKFFDQVYSGLDHTKPYAEQVAKIREEFPEYFNAEEPAPAPAPAGPTFGAPLAGKTPTGNEEGSFNTVWGYGKK